MIDTEIKQLKQKWAATHDREGAGSLPVSLEAGCILPVHKKNSSCLALLRGTDWQGEKGNNFWTPQRLELSGNSKPLSYIKAEVNRCFCGGKGFHTTPASAAILCHTRER